MNPANRSIQLVVCAASPARHTDHLASALIKLGHRINVIATAAGMAWLESERLREITGSRPATSWDEGRGEPGGHDVVVVAPATFNTISKITTGANDSLALNVIHEAIGDGRDVLLVPHLNSALHAHPLYRRNKASLSGLGITVLDPGPCTGGCPAGAHDAALLEWLTRHAV